MSTPAAEPVVASVGEKMRCPGCGETVTLDWADGWRNDRGLTCWPENTTHAQHIETLLARGSEEDR